MGIGVQRQEQIGLGGLGARHALAQGDEAVGRPRQHHAIAAAGLQLALQFAGDRHDHDLLLGAADTQRAGIPAAMAGVEEDQLGLGRRRRLGDGLLGRLIGPGRGRAKAKGGQAGEPGNDISAIGSGH